jgi:hypothetical protein
VDTGGGHDGIDVRMFAIDFVAMLAQQFSVNDAGTGLQPLGSPVRCEDAARAALQTIVRHRGYL